MSIRLTIVSLLLVALSSDGATAQAPAPQSAPPAAVDLRSPSERSTRYSAYSLPQGMWGFDLALLGISGDEVYGNIGVARGFGRGFQLDLNLLHWGVALFNASARWSFFEARHFALAADLGLIYAHGDWVWILSDLGQKVASGADLFALPLGLTASAPLTRWLQLDLVTKYQYSAVFGDVGLGESFYAETQFGARQLILRPGARFFVSDATAFELSARLPVYTRVPYQTDSTLDVGKGYGRSRDGYAKADFSQGWNLEAGVRSRLRPWLFASMRLHYGQVPKRLYGAALYPSFSLEFRL